MTWTVPDNATFLARFPEFAAVATAHIDVVLDEASRSVINGDGTVINQCWIENDYQDAIKYLTAHLLTLGGEPSKSNLAAAALASGGTTVAIDGIKRHKVGDVETEFFEQTNTGTDASISTTGTTTSASYQSTVYGQRFLILLKRSFPAVMIV